jgi:hypothetical protein
VDNQQIEVTQDQLDHGILTDKCNQVIVEIPYSSEGRKSKGGIIVGFNLDVTWEGDDAHNADCQEVYGVVYRTPERLYFNPTDNDSMDWETDLEVQKNDLVWFGIMASAGATELLCGGKVYKLIPYGELIVAKRGKEVIPLNGYTLCQTVNCKKISDLDVTSEDKIDKEKAIVRFTGSCNKRYKVATYVDHEDLRDGDLVLLDRYPLVFLERKKFFAEFMGDELFIVVPRKRISLVIKREVK